MDKRNGNKIKIKSCNINLNCQLKEHFDRQSVDLKAVLKKSFDKRLIDINENRIKFLEKILNEGVYDIIAIQEIDKKTIDDLRIILKSDNNKKKYMLICNDYYTSKNTTYKTNVVLLIKNKIINSVAGIDFNFIDNENYLNKNIVFTFTSKFKIKISNKYRNMIIKIINTHMTGDNFDYDIVVEKLKKEEFYNNCHFVLFLGDLNAYDINQNDEKKQVHENLIIKLKANDFRSFIKDNEKQNPFPDKNRTYRHNLNSDNVSKNDHIFWLKGTLFDQLDLSSNSPVEIDEKIDNTVNYCLKENIDKNDNFSLTPEKTSFTGFTDHSMLISILTINLK